MISRSSMTKSAGERSVGTWIGGGGDYDSPFLPGVNDPSSFSANDAYAASRVMPFNACARVKRCSGYLKGPLVDAIK
jgi:hypothetical protein